MEVEDFGSKTLLRVLNAISFHQRLNLSQIERLTGFKYLTVVRQVDALKRMGLVRELEGNYERKIVPTFNRLELSFLEEIGARAFKI